MSGHRLDEAEWADAFVADPRRETAKLYKVSRLRVVARASDTSERAAAVARRGAGATQTSRLDSHLAGTFDMSREYVCWDEQNHPASLWSRRRN